MISPQAASDITVRCNQCFYLAEVSADNTTRDVGDRLEQKCVDCGCLGVTVVAVGETKYTVFLATDYDIKIPPGFKDDAEDAFDAEWEDWDEPEIPTYGNLARYEITLCEKIERGNDGDMVSLPIGREPPEGGSFDEDCGYLHVHGWRVRRYADTQDATHVEEGGI